MPVLLIFPPSYWRAVDELFQEGCFSCETLMSPLTKEMREMVHIEVHHGIQSQRTASFTSSIVHSQTLEISFQRATKASYSRQTYPPRGGHMCGTSSPRLWAQLISWIQTLRFESRSIANLYLLSRSIAPSWRLPLFSTSRCSRANFSARLDTTDSEKGVFGSLSGQQETELFQLLRMVQRTE